MKFSKRRAPVDFAAAEEMTLTPEMAMRVETAPPADVVTTADKTAPAVLAGGAPAPYAPGAMTELAPPPGWPIWLAAFVVSVLWALAPIAFALGYRAEVAPFQNDAFALVVFALLAIGPAAFVWGAAFMIRQGQKLAFETRRAKAMAEDMLSPAVVAAARAGHVTQSIRDEIVRAGSAADEARETLVALRDALALETDRLAESAEQSVRTAHELTGALSRERTEMGVLSSTLDAQAVKVVDAIAQQAKMVADAAGLAETQIREAEGALAARAADLAAAAGEVSDTTRTAGEDLNRHIARLETAGTGVADQVRAVQDGLSEQRTALVTLASVLRSDHETFGQEADAHAERLQEFITQTRLSAMEMTDRATKGGEALRQLMADAASQFRDLAQTAQAERDEFGQSTLRALETVSGAAAEQRHMLEGQTRGAIQALANAAAETRAAAARHAATAREQIDQLSEAAFNAGQKANQVFEARLEEARLIVEQSSKMVEAAGASTAQRLEAGAAAARATLAELGQMMAEIETRTAQLPLAAQDQAAQVRETLVRGMDELTAHARRMADEAQAIDEAFQERVRRNFDMMSEAVRLMGGAVPPSPATAQPPKAQRAAAPPPAPPAPEFKPIERPAPAPEDGAAAAERLGLRPRLKLTPTASDTEFSAVFSAAGGPAPSAREAEPEPEPADEAWTWKDFLASLDGADGEGQRLEDTLSAELDRLGVESEKLLPKARLDEVAADLQAGDVEAARAVIKSLAPAAARRIARRLFTDDGVRREAEVYVRRYQTLVADARARDPSGRAMQQLMNGDAGRLFLLLDTAAGDML
jgi:hypothetical protein